jgi:hypothetical protein
MKHEKVKNIKNKKYKENVALYYYRCLNFHAQEKLLIAAEYKKM